MASSGGLYTEITPENTVFAFVSLEGPDKYSMAGGLGVRVTELSEALAQAGFETHLFFIGDPDAQDQQVMEDGRRFWRACQPIAARYVAGVYEGIDEKLAEFERAIPPLLLNKVARPVMAAGKLLVVLGEDWHTATTMAAISDLLYWQGLRSHAILLWNANSVFGFDRIDWARLQVATRVTAVSRYMKQLLWPYGINALVLPNGIPPRLLDPVPMEPVEALRRTLSERMLLTKFGRFDPDKNWMSAVQAVARLRAIDKKPLLIMRGGIEGYGNDVLAEIDALSLRRKDLTLDSPTLDEFLRAIESVEEEADVVFCRFFVPEEVQRVLYRASDAVLANSGHEPFGLVGLEVMAARGIAFVGSTGEQYAQHLLNAVSLDTEDPNEIVGNLVFIQNHPAVARDLRRVGHITARYYRWPHIIEKMISKLRYLLMSGGVTWP
jgi:glycosyltransferase involved in cell wall biosynthesis